MPATKSAALEAIMITRVLSISEVAWPGRMLRAAGEGRKTCVDGTRAGCLVPLSRAARSRVGSPNTLWICMPASIWTPALFGSSETAGDQYSVSRGSH